MALSPVIASARRALIIEGGTAGPDRGHLTHLTPAPGSTAGSLPCPARRLSTDLHHCGVAFCRTEISRSAARSVIFYARLE